MGRIKWSHRPHLAHGRSLEMPDLGYYADLNNFDNVTKIVECLPFQHQQHWLRYATAIEEDGLEVSFSDLARFVEDEAMVVNSSYAQIFKERSHNREPRFQCISQLSKW